MEPLVRWETPKKSLKWKRGVSGDKERLEKEGLEGSTYIDYFPMWVPPQGLFDLEMLRLRLGSHKELFVIIVMIQQKAFRQAYALCSGCGVLPGTLRWRLSYIKDVCLQHLYSKQDLCIQWSHKHFYGNYQLKLLQLCHI